METVLVEKKNINEVVELLKQDEVVAFPTETVFGLGVKFGNLSALEKIYEIKHRSHSKAVSLMIYDSQDIEKYAYVNTNAQKLIDEFMPGMITLVLKKKSILSDDFTAGLETIGIRIPDDPFVLELWPDTNEFLLRYNIGMFVYQSSKCGSFTNDDHFNRFVREMRFMCLNIKDAKEAYQERLDKRRKSNG